MARAIDPKKLKIGEIYGHKNDNDLFDVDGSINQECWLSKY